MKMESVLGYILRTLIDMSRMDGNWVGSHFTRLDFATKMITLYDTAVFAVPIPNRNVHFERSWAFIYYMKRTVLSG